MSYITVDGTGVQVSSQLASDVGHQILNGIGQGINIVFSVFVPILGVVIVAGFLYGLYRYITYYFRRKR